MGVNASVEPHFIYVNLIDRKENFGNVLLNTEIIRFYGKAINYRVVAIINLIEQRSLDTPAYTRYHASLI